MANHSTNWPALGFAYTGSNDGGGGGGGRGDGGDGGGRGNGGGRGDGGGRRNGNGGGNGDETSGVTNNGSYFNIGGNDQEGSSYSLKVNIPKMTGNNYNEWAQTVRLVLDSKGKLSFLTGAIAETAVGDPLYKQ
ncbi:glycine-rich protein DOT1-like [Vicia villosa]|uniref:glycine-rich protein DOT1-like n=1 Tax=Vicia villosa TaxID=3911 RepID=UPI00273B41E8|nr:glycine-rich protein DOT1-like [Vicia villosa]